MSKVVTVSTALPDSRRKLLLAGACGLLLPLSAISATGKTNSLFLDLQRDDQRLRLNVLDPEGYKAAAWLLRDIKAGNVVGQPNLNLLVWAARLQRALAEHHAYTVFAITSGLRTQASNRVVEGAAQNSRHLPDQGNQFHAMDIKPVGATLDQLSQFASKASFGGIGHYATHLHLDVRTSPARW